MSENTRRAFYAPEMREQHVLLKHLLAKAIDPQTQEVYTDENGAPVLASRTPGMAAPYLLALEKVVELMANLAPGDSITFTSILRDDNE